MKDMPVFTTEFGVASLILREIPYQQTAYIRIQASQDPMKLLEECISFCRMVGAERIFAMGDPCLERYPFHTAMYRMTAHRDSLGDTDAALWPVQEHTAGEFQTIFNRKAPSIPNGAWMTDSDTREMLKTGEGYFVHRDDNLLGIGRVYDGELRFVASVMPGAGADVVKQWDATLDGLTRESHVAVDGEIRELDEPFSNGLMFPGDPSGGAAEVINCRCAYLQRARWAVGGKFSKMNNFTGQLEDFDSPEAYDEFKKGFFSPENKRYMNYVKQMEEK